MTIIVSVKINDGIVMASDSAATFANQQIYLNADKIVNLVKGLPVGAMVTGDGGIGNESVATMLKDLRVRLDGSSDHLWSLNRQNYTMREIADRVHEFLFVEKSQSGAVPATMQLRMCGYSAGRPVAEVWEVWLEKGTSKGPTRVQNEEQFGVRWDGEYDAINRLLFGIGLHFEAAAVTAGISPTDVDRFAAEMRTALSSVMWTHTMPIQDAIDLARFLVETTIGFVKFSVFRQPKTVGGAIEIAAITKHEGFKWVQRKHFYSASLNP